MRAYGSIILKDHCGEWTKPVHAQRKWNSIGLVVGYLAVINIAKNTERMQEELIFASACAEINRIEAANKVAEQRKRPKILKTVLNLWQGKSIKTRTAPAS